jgi:DNA-binding response OmpR family regulator
MMPEIDGKEAVKQIRDIEEHCGIPSDDNVKIIMTTAVTHIKEVIQSFQQLWDAYLFKLIDTGKLLVELKSLHLVQ